MVTGELTEHLERLTAERRPFVLATVVRARRPTSVQPGNSALVLSDGTIEGFVGGLCAESSVRLYALRAIETGEPLLLSLVPGDGAEGDRAEPIDGAVVEHNPCLSGGSLEIFLEPHLPAPQILVVGVSPIAKAVQQLARAAGYDARRTAVGEIGAFTDAVDAAAAVIVASHGSGEEAVLAAALRSGVPYVALVASPKRGAAVRAELGLPAELSAQLHTPAGLDIGARTPNEIAISILAELVAEHYADPAPGRPGAGGEAPAVAGVAIDPVCGMKVAIADATPQLVVAGQAVFFCGDGCRDRYAAQHADASSAPAR
jgi:xanthine dehydrogenase accessory factor